MRKLKNNELNRINIEEFKSINKSPIVIVLDNVRSAHNVGSVFRTSDAFLIEKIILCGITAQPPHKDIRKTALGSTESIDWEYENSCTDSITKLKKEGYTIICIEQANESVKLGNFEIDSKQKIALVFGNEVNGVDQKIVSMSDTVLEIPQFGTKHSLNIAVSAGMVIWDLFNQLKRYE